MSATDEMIDLELIVSSGSPKCAIPKCGKDADYAMVLHQCGHQVLLCTSCKNRRIMKNIEYLADKGEPIKWKHSNCEVKNSTWDFLPI